MLVTLPGEGDPESGPVSGRIFSGTDAERYVEVIDGDGSNGALVPDLIADAVGVGPGRPDPVERHAHAPGRRRLSGPLQSPRSGYWSPWSEQIFRPVSGLPRPAAFILVGPDEAVRLTRDLHDPEERDIDYGWVAPIDDLSLDVDQARDVRAYAARMLGEVTDRKTQAGASLRVLRPGSWPARFFSGTTGHGVPLVDAAGAPRSRSKDGHRRGPLRLLLIAGLGVAAAVVAAAAAFAVAGRRTEAAFLHAHGWGPVRFAAKAIRRGSHPDRPRGGRGIRSGVVVDRDVRAGGAGGPLGPDGLAHVGGGRWRRRPARPRRRVRRLLHPDLRGPLPEAPARVGAVGGPRHRRRAAGALAGSTPAAP